MISDTLASWLIAQTWQVSAAIIVVGLLAHRIGRTRPHLAHMLWLVVLLKCFTPPVWTSPSGVFCWLLPVAREEGRVDIELLDGALNESVADLGVNSRAGVHGELRLTTPHEPFVDTYGLGSQTFWTRFAANSQWKPAVLALWFGGATAVLFFGAVRARRFFARLRASGLAESPTLTDLVERLRHELGVSRRVRVLVTPTGIGPVVVGLFAPTIYLPRSLVDGCSLETLEPILAHELVHQRRGDLWLCWLQWLARGLWWFHPLVAWACRRWNREIERCCDEETVAGMNYSPGRYARSLLEVLERKQALRAAPLFPGVRPLEITSQRLERIMRLGQGSHRRTPWWCWACLVVVACLVLPGAAFVAEAKDRRKTRRASRPSTLLPALPGEFAAPVPETTGSPGTESPEAADFDAIQMSVSVWKCDPAAWERTVARGSRMTSSADRSGIACQRDVVQRWLESLQSDPRTERLSAPRIVARSGQVANVAIVDLHPFIVGYANSEPIVETRRSGLEIDLTGHRQAGGDLELSFDARHSEIVHVEESKDGEGRLIQTPILREAKLSTRLILGANQLLVAPGPIVSRKDGTKERLIFVVGCSLQLPPAHGGTLLRVYHVADLVVPIPGEGSAEIHVSRPDGKEWWKPHADGLEKVPATHAIPPAADFEPLVKLIKETINPDMWKDTGSGRIEPRRENMSLVVNADNETHDKLTELLGQLRRLQSVQIVFDMRLIRPDADLVKAAEREQWQWHEPGRIATGPPVALLDVATHQRLMERIASHRGEVLQAPKVTLFNGQSLQMNLPIPRSERPHEREASTRETVADQPSEIAVRMAAVASVDRQRMRLTIAPGKAARGDQSLSALAVRELDDGVTLVIDLTNDVRWREWNERGPLARLPEGQQLLSDFGKSDKRPPLWLIATPRIIFTPVEMP